MSNPLNPYWIQKEETGFGTGAGSDINRLHDYDDLDSSILAHHHTLGGTSTQASAGNHTHNGIDSPKIGLLSRVSSSSALAAAATGTELKDTGIGDVIWQPVNKGIYAFKYKGRSVAATAIESGDLILRYAVYPASPTNISTQLDAISIPALSGVGGAFSLGLTFDAFVICPDDVAPGKYNVAVFYKGTSGTGTIVMNQSAGSRRQFSIRLDGWK